MKLSRLFLIITLAVAGSLSSVNADLRFGVKAGMAASSLHFNSKLFDSSNRAGFTGGVMLEYTAPILGLGFDASLMYVGRTQKFTDKNGVESKHHSNYFEIPLNLKWRISIPVINNVFRPYLATGPAFSVLAGRQSFNDFRSRRFDTSWSFGLGFDLFKKVQIGASYGIGITKSITQSSTVSGRNNGWTVTAAYMF